MHCPKHMLRSSACERTQAVRSFIICKAVSPLSSECAVCHSMADLSILHAVFPPEASEGGKLNIFVPRMIFIFIQAAGLAFGAWKLHTMGLLPTHASDFVSSLSVPVNKEFSSAGTSLV